MSAPSIFISYSRENTEFVNRLRRDLHDYGVKVWRDHEDIGAAENFNRVIKQAIDEHDVFAIISSKEFLERHKHKDRETAVKNRNPVSGELLPFDAVRECFYAARNKGLGRRIRNWLKRRPIKPARLVQLQIDKTEGRDISEFFERLGLSQYNHYSRIDFHTSYDEGLAKLIGTADAADIRKKRERENQIPRSQIRGWNIEHMPDYKYFDPPVTSSNIITEFAPQKELPKPLREYYESQTEETIRNLQKGGRAITINDGYSAQKIIFNKSQTKGVSGRFHHPHIVFEEADYSFQIMFSNKLDSIDTIEISDSKYTIREYLSEFEGIDLNNFSWDDIERIPFPQRFANGVSLIVKGDGPDAEQRGLVIGVRSKQSLVRNVSLEGTQVGCTVSCAEGMLRPDDALPGREDGAPSPVRTAARALNEELGLQVGKDFEEDDIQILALGYDTQRCQPVASHLIELNNLHFSDIKEKWGNAIDKNEHRALEWIPLKEKEYNLFMNDEWIWRGAKLHLFSNHQRFCAATLGLREFGQENI